MHAGHERLLSACRKFSKVSIGLTSDSFARRHKIYPSLPYTGRRYSLKLALKKFKLASKTEIFRIDDEMGGAGRMEGIDAIIVSGETEGAAHRINSVRRRHGLPLLEIIVVPIVYGEDLKKISCADIYEGKIDLEGRLRKPVSMQVGTGNPTKLAGTSRALGRIFGKRFILRHHSENSRVADHPFNTETFDGAKNRAHAAWKRAYGMGRGRKGGSAGSGSGCDYSIGMESGLFTLRKGMHIDITVCCAYDGKDETYGTGMGFVVPEEIAKKIKREKTDLTRVLAEMDGVKDIGRKHGAIGHFSAGVLHRSEQIEQSVLCAFVPRLAKARVKAKK